MLFVLIMMSSCAGSGLVKTDIGCQIWRENTPLASPKDTKKTLEDLIVFNEVMEKACAN